MEATRRYADWCQARFGEYRPKEPRDRAEWERIQREVVQATRTEHERSPKYDLRHGRRSPSSVLIEHHVTQIDLKATYVDQEGGRARVLDGANPVSVEKFVTATLERDGSTVVFCESRVFHAIFGTFMWLLVNDPVDPNSKMVMFGRSKANESGDDIEWMQFPMDFGSEGYAKRRVDALAAHMKFLRDNAVDVKWLFVYWQTPSFRLRQYLHAWEPEVSVRARRVVELLPWPSTEAILRYLVENYWGRYLGWPDLLVVKGGEFFFAEVKSSKDTLHPDQQRWIGDNATMLGFPFKLIKVHRMNPRSTRRRQDTEG